MGLGEEIKKRRLERGVSLREFARRVGVSAPFVTDLEAGRRHPGAEVLGRIARELDVPVAVLEDFDSRLSPEVRRWVESEPEVGRMLRSIRSSPRRDEMLRRIRRIVEDQG
jgi:transcriptional regulator with XRE-family HTH domain